jgi:SAM-dependent methyltransferase
MFNILDENQINGLINGELGINVIRFMEIVNSMGKNNTFVDIGVETGKSSKILLNNAIENNNKVIGIDPIPAMDPAILENPNYVYIKGDSVHFGNVVGAEYLPISIAFIDSIHADVQVLCELKAWWKHIKVGGWAIFHDTAWTWLDENGNKQYYIHKPNHPCAGRKTGNSAQGCDVYGGIHWPTPDSAVKRFFGLKNLEEGIFETEDIYLEHSKKDLGMTFIKKKTSRDFSTDISEEEWSGIENKRVYLLRSFGA